MLYWKLELLLQSVLALARNIKRTECSSPKHLYYCVVLNSQREELELLDLSCFTADHSQDCTKPDLVAAAERFRWNCSVPG